MNKYNDYDTINNPEGNNDSYYFEDGFQKQLEISKKKLKDIFQTFCTKELVNEEDFSLEYFKAPKKYFFSIQLEPTIKNLGDNTLDDEFVYLDKVTKIITNLEYVIGFYTPIGYNKIEQNVEQHIKDEETDEIKTIGSVLNVVKLTTYLNDQEEVPEKYYGWIFVNWLDILRVSIRQFN